MEQTVLTMLGQGREGAGPRTLDDVLANVAQLMPMLDVLPNAAIFIKDCEARYVAANSTLVQRCGLEKLERLLGKTCAEVFPAKLGVGYTEQDLRVMKQRLILKDQLEVHLYGSKELGWCLSHKWPLYSAQGTVIGLVGISVDLQAAKETHPAYQRLAEVNEYIRSHFHHRVTLRELTRIAGISVAQLERYCKRVFQLTPRQMIQKARLEHAHRLLQTEMPITEVALHCGYTDHSAFTRQFKELTGFTPSEYRQAQS